MTSASTGSGGSINNLDPHHLADLHKSGLNNKTIEMSGITTLAKCEIERETDFTLLPVPSAYRVPFYEKNYSRTSCFNSEEAPSGALLPKYIQMPSHSNRLYIPDLVVPVLQDLTKLLFITVGETRALKAAQEGIACIAITSFSGWKRPGTDELIRDFDEIGMKGRAICIVPDSDWLDLDSNGYQKNFKQAVNRLAVALQLRGARVSICAMPAGNDGKVGIDDYLNCNTIDNFLALPRPNVELENCYRLEDGNINFYEVEQDTIDGETITSYAPPVKLASAIEITAYTRNNMQEEWGRLLQFHDNDGRIHRWIMPMKLLSADGAELRRELFRQGLPYINSYSKYRHHLIIYLQITVPDEERRARCVDTIGWHGRTFVLPDFSIGKTDETLIYQKSAESIVRQSGTLVDWQQTVARLCIGNSRLVFAVSCAFAAPLLHISNKENGGFHLSGPSSIGKTTALFAARSVFSDKKYLQSWRATVNGLEGIATSHNDLLLILDELAQVEPQVAGETAYMLANGSGKNRAGGNGDTRPKKLWNTLFLSSGEISLTDHMLTCGKKAMAGQEVRLADIPADTGKHGIFENLHGYNDGAEMSRAFKKFSDTNYGTAGIEFIRRLTEEWDNLPPAIEKVRTEFIAQLPSDCDGQMHRVAERFALVAAAGEIATAFSISGWQPGEATKAAFACLQAWIQARTGNGHQEEHTIKSQVRHFFQLHSDSRFSEWENKNDARPTINRAGFRRKIGMGDESGGFEYFVFCKVFREEVCNGLNNQTAVKLLIQLGVLQPGSDGRPSALVRLPGMGQVRCYRFNQTLLEDNR